MTSPHPGKILLQHYLQPMKLSQNALARAIRVPPRRINEIVQEKRAITADTAVRLAIYFGNSAGDWMQLQSAFDIDRVKPKITARLGDVIPAPETDRTTDNKTQTQEQKIHTGIKKRMMR